MSRRKRHQNAAHDRPGELPREAAAGVRIIGGTLRGRKLVHQPDERTRPMKDRTREAVFNLIGPSVQGKHVIDLFAGTGALGFEALSRGAASTTMIEKHFPTAAIIRQNAALLKVTDRVTVEPANSLIWAQRQVPGEIPWLVFCCPPYALYVERADEILLALSRLFDAALVGSMFVVEADARFDLSRLSASIDWDVREYPPAVIALGKKA